MKWPWQKPPKPDVADGISEAALWCFNKHADIVNGLIGRERLDQIPLENNLIAACETVCAYLHFVDRTLCDVAPRERQHRMDGLVVASVSILSSLVERMGGVEKQEAHQLSHNQFLEIYDERGKEYASVGNDWFKKVLLRYATHLVQILNEHDPSFELIVDPDHVSFRMVMKAQEQFVHGFGDMMKEVPALFKA